MDKVGSIFGRRAGKEDNLPPDAGGHWPGGIHLHHVGHARDALGQQRHPDALPHNGTVLILLNLSGLTHRESYFDMVMTVIVSCIIPLVALLVMGSAFGSF